MDKIWDGKSFEVGGHWPLWRRWKHRLTTQNRRNRTLKKNKKKESCFRKKSGGHSSGLFLFLTTCSNCK